VRDLRIAVPVALAAVAVAVQIAYPHLAGSARDGATIAIVLLLAGASVVHAAVVHGLRAAATITGVLAGGGLAVELLGVATGFPFGTYAYADRLGPMVGEVPLLIPLAWTMLGYPALVVARLITPSRWAGVAVGASALATWDLFLDPQMVAEGYWTWSSTGPHLGVIPLTNYLAWYGTAWLMMAGMWHVTAAWGRSRAEVAVPVGLYLWTWIGSVVAHAWFLDLPQSALAGGIGMGAVVAVLARSHLRATAAAGEAGVPLPGAARPEGAAR
jgi:uncharacterized membrane protein